MDEIKDILTGIKMKKYYPPILPIIDESNPKLVEFNTFNEYEKIIIKIQTSSEYSGIRYILITNFGKIILFNKLHPEQTIYDDLKFKISKKYNSIIRYYLNKYASRCGSDKDFDDEFVYDDKMGYFSYINIIRILLILSNYHLVRFENKTTDKKLNNELIENISKQLNETCIE